MLKYTTEKYTLYKRDHLQLAKGFAQETMQMNGSYTQTQLSLTVQDLCNEGMMSTSCDLLNEQSVAYSQGK